MRIRTMRKTKLLNIMVMYCYEWPKRIPELLRTSPTVSGKVGVESLRSIIPHVSSILHKINYIYSGTCLHILDYINNKITGPLRKVITGLSAWRLLYGVVRNIVYQNCKSPLRCLAVRFVYS